MHRRALIGTAATLVTPLVAGCTRDGGDGDGEDGGSGDGEGADGGDGGGGGPYGMIGTGGTDMAARDADGTGDAGGVEARSHSRRSGGPALGPESRGETDVG